ncbi:unnamed protein product, partial [Prunus brigantina]
MSGPKEYPKLKRGSNAQKRIQGFKEETARPGSVFDVLRAPNITNWAAI